jgi:hypothetical protein
MLPYLAHNCSRVRTTPGVLGRGRNSTGGIPWYQSCVARSLSPVALRTSHTAMGPAWVVWQSCARAKAPNGRHRAASDRGPSSGCPIGERSIGERSIGGRLSGRRPSGLQASKRQASKMEASKRLTSERRASKRQRLGHDVDSASSVGRWRSPLVRLGDGPAERARGHTRESHEPRARSARACAGHPGRTHAGREAQDVCIRAARSTRCRGAAGRTLAC